MALIFWLNIGSALAKMEIKRNDRKAQSPRLDKLAFGSFNKAFKPDMRIL